MLKWFLFNQILLQLFGDQRQALCWCACLSEMVLIECVAAAIWACATSLSLVSIASTSSPSPPPPPPPPPPALSPTEVLGIIGAGVNLVDSIWQHHQDMQQHIRQLEDEQHMRQEAADQANRSNRNLFLTVLAIPVLTIPMLFLFLFFKGGRRVRRHPRANLDQRVERSPSQSSEERMAALSRRPNTVHPLDSDHASDFDGHPSSISEISGSSWILVYPTCCFLPDTFFEVQRDNGERILMRAGQLCAGARVLAANGQWVEVWNPPELHEVPEVIELAACNASLTVSPEHRFIIPGGQTVQATELDVGRKVLLMGGIEATLTSFIRRREPTTVLKIAFTPDYPVCAFMELAGILSRGYRRRPLRRVDNVSMPATEPQITP